MSDDAAVDESVRLRQLRHHAPAEYLAQQFGDVGVKRLIAALDNGVPAEALAAAARWWQLETYLRLLVYIELRALLGPAWMEPLSDRTALRAEAAEAHRYMASADDGHLLAHVDAGRLFQLIDQYWDQCEAGIGLPRTVWQGRIAELLPIRHRIAHCRRPHGDDVPRIEQLMRDLEPAANRALRSYLNWWTPKSDLDDPVVHDWMHLRHPVAARLVEHGRQNKGIEFSLLASRRAWAADASRITGSSGFYWVLQIHFDHPRRMYIDDYWAQQPVRALLPMVGHVVQDAPWSLQITMPAVGDQVAISDAIGATLSPASSRRVRPRMRA